MAIVGHDHSWYLIERPNNNGKAKHIIVRWSPFVVRRLLIIIARYSFPFEICDNKIAMPFTKQCAIMKNN